MNKKSNTLESKKGSKILFFFVMLVTQLVQAQTNITTSDVTIPNGSGTSMSVAYHPVFQRYYASTGGNGSSSVATSTSAGVLITNTSHNFDNRGLWYNPNTNRIEGSNVGASIIGYYPLDVNGNLVANGNVTTIISGSFSSVGQNGVTYNNNANEYLIRNSSTEVRRYSVAGVLLGTITITIPSGANFQSYHLAYTGIAGRELGFYDYTNKRLYTYGLSGGTFTHYYQLPASAPSISSWGFSYANGRVFINNGTTWLGYPVQVLAGSLNFDGTNDYCSIASNSNLNLTDSFTIEAWIKPSSFNWLGGIISKYQTGSANGFTFRLGQTSPYTSLDFNGMVTANGVLTANQWHHVAVVVNNSAGNPKIYINGVLTATSGTPHTMALNTDSVTIGVDFNQSAGPRFFNGNIDEVRIWKRVLNVNEIVANRSCELHPSNRSGLRAYYKFNTGVVSNSNAGLSTLTDSSGNGLNMTLNNFALSGATSNWGEAAINVACSGPSCPAPTINVQPVSKRSCLGFPVSLTAQVSGNGTSIYQWYKNGVLISGANTATLTRSSLAWSDTGSYVLVIKDTCTLYGISSQVSTTSARIDVSTGPTIIAQPIGSVVCTSNSTSISVSAIGTGTLTYQWRKNGVNIPSATSATYTIASMSVSDTGTYTVTVNDTCGATSSSPAQINFLNITPPTVANASVCASSGNVTLTNTTTPASGYTTTWYDNASLTVLLSTGSSLTRNYTATDTVYVRNEPQGTLLSGATSIDHNSITSDDRGGIAVIQDYVYYFGDSYIARYNASNLTGGTQLTLRDGLFATYGGTGTLYAFGNVSAPFANSNGGTATHVWRVDSALNPITGSAVALSSSVTLTGMLASGPDFVLIGTSTIYKINPTTGVVTTLATNRTNLSPMGSESWGAYGYATIENGMHNIVYRASSIYNNGLAKFLVDSNTNTPVFDPGASLGGYSVFSDLAAIAYAPWNNRLYFHHEGGTSYTASTNYAETGGYVNFPVTWANSCNSAVDTVIVSVGSTPTITATTPAGRCGTGTLTLGATASAGTINWYVAATGGTSLATGTSYTTPSISTTTTYYVDATNGGCTTATRTAITATIGTGPVISVHPATASVCTSTSASLSVSASGTGTLTYQWRKNGVNIPLATASIYSINNMSSADTGSYTVVITDSCSSLTSNAAQVSLNIVGIPTVNNGSVCGASGSVTLTNTSTTPSGYTTKWYDNAALTTLLTTGSSLTRTYAVTDTVFVRNEPNGTMLAGATTVDHNSITNDDRAGIAVTQNYVYFFGDSYVARYNATTLTGGTQLTLRDGVFATYGGTGTLYCFGTVTGPYANNNGGIATHVWRLDTALNAISGSAVALSSSVNVTGMIAPGSDYVLVGSTSVTRVNPTTGVVTVLNANTNNMQQTGSEGFAAYGFATLEGGNYYITYRPSSLYNAGLAKFDVTNNSNSSVFDPGATINGNSIFSDMAAIALAPWSNKMYFHFEGGTTYTGSTNNAETGGYVNYPISWGNGCNSAIDTVVVTVGTAPTVATTTPATRCGSGTVTLKATASAGAINWYAAATGGTSLATDTSFTTPSISATTTYYVDATNNGCTTATRTAVIATVNTIPTVTASTPAAICGTGTATLGATASAGTLNWYAAATGGTSLATGTSFTTPSISATTTYYVDATNNGCTTATRTAVIATVNAIPTVTATTPASICGTGTATIGATASAGTLNWYAAATGGTSLATGTSFTTPSISATTTYYVDATNNGCTTATRTAVIVTVGTAPTVTASTPANRCGTGTVTLGATASAGTLNWYAAATGGTSLATGTSFTTPSISATTTYYVDATNNGCTTATRTAVIATVNAIPTVTATTPANRCGAGTVTLGATASAGTLNWYAAATGGTSLATGTSYTTPSISATTTYYVDATNNGCTTATRTAVIATVNTIPSVTASTPANRCGAGTVTLGATASAGTLNWYAAATGGTSLATGTSFTTPSISATTTYYVDATNNGCTTATRSAVIATVNVKPVTSTISGRTSVHKDTLETYSVINTIGAVYNWTIIGGVKLSGGTTNSIVVRWDSSYTSGTVKVVETSLLGCSGDTVVKSIVSIVPVEFMSFDAKRTKNKAALTWVTASELNNDRFEIERSLDNNNFEYIATVKGHGTTLFVNNYNYNDDITALLNTGLTQVYYRLKQVDYNGKFAYSPVRAINLNNEFAFDIQAVPNPSNGKFTVRFNSMENKDGVLKIYDNKGALIWSNSVKLAKGINEQLINLDLSQGIYNILFDSGDDSQTIRVIIK